MIRSDGPLRPKTPATKTPAAPVDGSKVPPGTIQNTEKTEKSSETRLRDERRDLQRGEGPTVVSGVLKGAQVVGRGAKSGLDVRIGAMTAKTTGAVARLGLVTPRAGGSDLPAEERLRALVTKTTAQAVPLDVDAAIKLMRERLGPLAVHLSHDEVATAIGFPGNGAMLKAQLGPLGLCDTSHGSQPHFRLAASLARWMEHIDFGATRAEVVASFLAVHQDVKGMVPHLDGDFLAVLQRAYPFMPQWAEKPRGVDALEDGVNIWLKGTENAAKTSLSQALDKIAEVPLSLPLTRGVGEGLTKRQAFADHNVVLVQHMLGQAVPFVEAMTKAGMNVDNAEYVGIPYQQNPAVAVTLEKTFGIPVTVPRRGDMDAMWETVCASVDRAYERHLKNGQPILILDDGGYASKYICEKYKDKQHLFKVVEQTTRGLTEIHKLDPAPEFPIVNVAGSHGKRFESNQIGDVVVHAVRKILDVASSTPARKPVLVVGAGKVGAAVAESFKGDGAKVTIFDPFINKARKTELEAKGFTVITDKDEALKGRFLVVGCSGHRSIDMNDFTRLSGSSPGGDERSSPVFVASASSKRVEIDTLGLEKLSTDEKGSLRRVLAGRVNEQDTWHYWMNDGRVVTAMADGLPVNFQGVNSVAPELIDHTMALMLLAAGQATTAKPVVGRPLLDLDHASQWQIQMRLDGLRPARSVDVHTEAMPILELYGEKVRGTRAQWLEVAKSPATPPDVVLAMYEHFSAEDPMDPIALACLGSHHDATPELVEAVSQRGILPHLSRMLQHESIPVGEQDRLMGALILAAQDLTTNSFAGSVASLRTSINVDATGGVTTRRFDPTQWIDLGNGQMKTVLNERAPLGQQPSAYGRVVDEGAVWDEVKEHVLSQVAAVLLSHPRCPIDAAMTLFGALAPTRLGLVRAENVLALQKTPWPKETLEKLFDKALPDLRVIPGDRSHGGIDGDVIPLEQRCRYVADVLNAFAEHPSATPALKQKVAAELKELKAFIGDRFILGTSEDWPVSPALGIPLPTYR